MFVYSRHVGQLVVEREGRWRESSNNFFVRLLSCFGSFWKLVGKGQHANGISNQKFILFHALILSLYGTTYLFNSVKMGGKKIISPMEAGTMRKVVYTCIDMKEPLSRLEQRSTVNNAYLSPPFPKSSIWEIMKPSPSTQNAMSPITCNV